MPINSRAKGARGERLFRDFLRDIYGDGEARRGQQIKGGQDAPDVESPMLRELKIHPEVKFMGECKLTQPGVLTSWLAQASRDAGPEGRPVVFHKWDRSAWWAISLLPSGRTVIMTAEEFLDEAIESTKEHQLAHAQGAGHETPDAG